MVECPRRAVAFVQHVGCATPACADHVRVISGGRILERIGRVRACAFEALPRAMKLTEFAIVIAEAIPRCICGGLAAYCPPCARRMIRPLASTRPVDDD